MKIKSLVVSFLCLLAMHVCAEPVLSVTDQEDHYLLSNILQYSVDDTAKATLDDMRHEHNRFIVNHADAVSVGFSNAALWTKLNIKNDTDTAQELLLVVTQPLLIHVELYDVRSTEEKSIVTVAAEPDATGQQESIQPSIQEGKPVEVKTTREKITRADFGLQNINKDNVLQSRYPNYAISLSPGESRTVYYRVTASNIIFPLTVWKKEAFIKYDHFDQYISGYYYGMLSLVGIFNFLMFFIVREKSHLYYVGFLIAFICSMSSIEGFFMEHGAPFISHNALLILYTLDSIMVMMLCLYAAHFMDIPILRPKWYLIMLASGAFCLLTSIIPFIFGIHGFDVFHTILVSVVCVMIIGMGTNLMIRGNLWARYFMAAWSALLLGAIIYVLTTFGVLPHNHVTANAIQMGSVGEAILQSLGLAAKMANLKKESELANQAVENLKKQADIQMKTFTQLLRFASAPRDK